ncbi:MAG: host-nuclease inhibitor Gam family protein [Armatimonadota bacterium]
MISQEHTATQVAVQSREAYGYAYATITTETEPACPVCGAYLALMDAENDYWECLNASCRFINNLAAQQVMLSLLEGKNYTMDELLGAIEMVVQYTLAEDTTFHIHDHESAGWYMKKIARIEAAMAEINREPDARIAELKAEAAAIEERRREMLKGPERDLLYLTTRYEPELQAWAEAELKDSKSKSIKLSYGTVGSQKTRPANVVDVETDTLVFAERAELLQDPETAVQFINTKKSIYKDAFFKWLSEHPDHERVRIEEDGTISLLEDNPFLDEGEEPAVIAHIAPAGEKFYVKAAIPGGAK